MRYNGAAMRIPSLAAFAALAASGLITGCLAPAPAAAPMRADDAAARAAPAAEAPVAAVPSEVPS